MSDNPWPDTWKVSLEVTVGKLHLTADPETWFKVRGFQGTFKFLRHVIEGGDMEWIDCVSTGEDGRLIFRSFEPDIVTELVKPSRREASPRPRPTRQ